MAPKEGTLEMAAKPYTFGCTLAAALALVAATLVAAAPPASGAGARPVTDTHAGDADHGHAEDLTRVGRRLFFEIEDTIHGAELWRTNGTRRGTRLVRDIRRGDESSDPWPLSGSGIPGRGYEFRFPCRAELPRPGPVG